MKLVCSCRGWAAGAIISLVASMAFASSGGSATFKEGVNYIAIKPPLVVNYGGPGRVKYIKAELSLRTEDAHSAAEVSHHMPLIRDTLIMLISSVTDEQMASAEGKEKMRVEALAKINEVLENVNHPNGAPEPAKGNDRAKQEKVKSGNAKKNEKPAGEETAKEAHRAPLVSDVLFDNLVVQK